MIRASLHPAFVSEVISLFSNLENNQSMGINVWNDLCREWVLFLK
jgi:hypothetical protein